MTMNKAHWMLLAAPLALAACDSAEESTPVDASVLESRSGELGPNTKDYEDYYVVRQDFRRCASPMCGGWFLSHVNHALMECADGSVADECYVARIDTPVGIGIEDGDLVHGYLMSEDIAGSSWGILESDFAYAPVLEEPFDFGSYNLVYNTGIVCITTPCPSTGLAHLNTELGLTDFDVFFFGADADEDQQLEDAYNAEYAADVGEPGGGALTFGQFWLIFGDVYYAVHNVYTLKVSDAPVCVVEDDGNTTTAWTFDNEAAAQGLIPALTGDVTVLDGICGDQQLFCPAVYMPVSGGIDANGGACEMHGNACEFRSAVISAAGDNKARGTYADGPC